MKIFVADYAGACYGVNRALKLALQEAQDSADVYTIGPLIHNPEVVAELETKGIRVASSLDELPDKAALVIRSHGVTPSVIAKARSRGLKVTDATCPHVSKAQRAAEDLHSLGYRVVVVGEDGHPEVEGILAYAGKDAIVADSIADLPDDVEGRIGIVVQTTQSYDKLMTITNELNGRGCILDVRDTICFATQQRQRSARELASKVDAMIVIGGRNSGNTRRLHEICLMSCPESFHIETPDEIDPAWFEGCVNVGVTAGASTPPAQIGYVTSFLEQLK